MAKNIAVLGDAESIKGFSAVGLDIYPFDEETDVTALLRRIADSDRYAVIYVTEAVYFATEKARARYAERLTPAIIPIPGVSGNKGTGVRRLSSFVEKAVGSDRRGYARREYVRRCARQLAAFDWRDYRDARRPRVHSGI